MTNSATTAASKLGWKYGTPAPQTRVSSTLIDFWAAAALAADFPQSKLDFHKTFAIKASSVEKSAVQTVSTGTGGSGNELVFTLTRPACLRGWVESDRLEPGRGGG